VPESQEQQPAPNPFDRPPVTPPGAPQPHAGVSTPPKQPNDALTEAGLGADPTPSAPEGSPSTSPAGTEQPSSGASEAASSGESSSAEEAIISVPKFGPWYTVVCEDGRMFKMMLDGSDRTGGIRVCLRNGAQGINLNDAGTDLAGR